jgi:hypothetical protein
MTTSFQTDGGALWATQNAGSELDYTLDWSETVGFGDAIANSEWTAEAGLSLAAKSFTDTTATAWISGGIAGRSYGVTNTIITSAGRRDSKTFRIEVKDSLTLGVGRRSVFPSIPEAILGLRRDRLMGPTTTWMAGVELSDEYLLEKLVSAEAEVERALRVFITPVEVLPTTTHQDVRDALDADGQRWVEEPGYDHDGSMVWGRSWAATDLRQRPVIRIREIRFAYPDPESTLFEVPTNWIRLDKKYGRFQLVPVQSVGAMQLSSVVLSALSAGMTIPLAIQVRYVAGLENAARDFPDVLSLIKRKAVLSILDEQFLAASGSTSVDGLSQSMSWDAGPHHKTIDDKLERLRQSIHGIRLAVL